MSNFTQSTQTLTGIFWKWYDRMHTST